MEEKLRLELADQLSRLMPTLHRKCMHCIEFPLPPNALWTLVTLNDYGTQTLTQLSRRLLMSKQQMSPIVEKLQQNGYIERSPALQDRRSILISITDNGTTILTGCQERSRELFLQRLTQLDSKETKKFQRTLAEFFFLFDKL